MLHRARDRARAAALSRTLDEHARGRRVPHAGRVRASRRQVDGVARAARQLAPGARPAQEAFAAVATAIAAGRAGDVAASAEQFERAARAAAAGGARRRDVDRRRLDARHRPDLRRRRRRRPPRRRLDLQRLGRADGGLYLPWDRDDAAARQGARDRARRSLPGADRARGRRDPRRRRGHGADDRGVPAQPQPQPRALARADRAAAAATTSAPRRCSGSAPASSRTRPTATSTTSPASPRPGVVALTWTDDEADPQHAVSADAGGGCKRRPTRAGARSRSIAPPAGPADDHRRGGGAASRPRAGTQAAPRRRPPRRLLRQLLPRATGASSCPLLDPRYDDAAAEKLAELFPEPRGRRRAGPRDPARRRQHPLHHPAAAGGARLRRVSRRRRR